MPLDPIREKILELCFIHSLFVQRDLAALKNKITILSQECERLCSTYPESSPRVRGKEREVARAWEGLLTRSQVRKDKLVEAEQLQRYLNTFRDLR